MELSLDRKPARVWIARGTLGALLAAALVGTGATTASAHARLIASTPRENALLGGTPKTIELWFNELLDDDFNGIELFNSVAPGGERPNLAAGPAKVNADDRTHLSVPIDRALAPGTYLVHWKVLSRDGHTARGRFSFRVLPDRDGAY